MEKLCVLAFAIALAGCSINDLNGSRATEQHISASCRQLDADVDLALHPTPAMITRHDQLMQKATDLNSQAQAVMARGGDADDLIGQSVQAKEDADGIYDAAAYRQEADSCWAMLGVVRETQADMRQRELNAADGIGASAQPTTIFTDATTSAPAPSQTEPPAPPSPSPVGTISPYEAAPASPTTQYVPYGAVGSFMPGIDPSGAAR